MRSRKLHGWTGPRTYSVVLDKGDEAVELLGQFAREQGISGVGITADIPVNAAGGGAVRDR